VSCTRAAFQPHLKLDGLPLATPKERIAAFAIDVMLLFIPSILVATAAAAGALAVRNPDGFDATWTMMTAKPADPAAKRALLGRVAALLVRIDAPGLPPAIALAVEEGDLERAGGLLDAYDINFNIDQNSGGGPPLEVNQIRLDLDEMIPAALRGAALFGVAGLYFTVLTARGRRTLGKRPTGTRVIAVDGKPLTI
jgi:uncharacterized RDD family membrane protein YckC